VDCAVRALETARGEGSRVRFVILGDGDYLPEVRRMVAEGDRAAWVDVRGAVPLEAVPDVIAEADLGVVPNRGGAFNDLALPTRIFEYLSMGIPVVTSRSPAVTALFDEADLLFFDSGDEADLSRVLSRALSDAASREQCVTRGGRVAAKHAWDVEKRIYLDVVRRLTSSSGPEVAASSR
jgi:glycosyltransferase involved in cell wall biosynthesis